MSRSKEEAVFFDTTKQDHVRIEAGQRALAAANARAEAARADAIEEAAKACEQVSFGTEIGEWMNMTKKEVSARACLQCAAAARALVQEEGHHG